MADTLLQEYQLRSTPVRRALVALFECNCAPQSAQDIQSALEDQGLKPNKTTVYRELETLCQVGILRELDFGEGKKRYERSGHHHHHLICESCSCVQELELPAHLAEHETMIRNEYNFRVTRHVLEFFGLCRDCDKQR